MENTTANVTCRPDFALNANCFIKDSPAGNIAESVKQPVVAFSLLDRGSVSAATWNLVDRFFTLSLPAFGVIELFFSIVNASVYFKQRRSAFAVYLLGISLSDALFSFVQLVQSALLFVFPVGSYAATALGLYFYSYLGTSFSRTAICLNALASLERFVVVAFPLKITDSCSRKTPTIVVGIVFAASLVGHSYFFLEFEVKTAVSPVNVTEAVWASVPTTLRLKYLSAFEVVKNTMRILFIYVPLIFSFVINVCLVLALHIFAVKRREMRVERGGVKTDGSEKSSKTSTDNQTTKLILVFTFTFFLLALPLTINVTIASILPNYGIFKVEHYLYNSITRAMQTLGFLTEVAQFIACFLYSRQFRSAFFQLQPFQTCRLKLKQTSGLDFRSEISSHDKDMSLSKTVTIVDEAL